MTDEGFKYFLDALFRHQSESQCKYIGALAPDGIGFCALSIIFPVKSFFCLSSKFCKISKNKIQSILSKDLAPILNEIDEILTNDLKT